ncbi:MAG: protein TolQ, partial [Alcaligenaceae bacterium]|nr:protein TolQ [Alcaligenaceae bacterium]
MQPVQDEMSIFSLIVNASIPVQVIMLILLAISVVSWTYIIT